MTTPARPAYRIQDLIERQTLSNKPDKIAVAVAPMGLLSQQPQEETIGLLPHGTHADLQANSEKETSPSLTHP